MTVQAYNIVDNRWKLYLFLFSVNFSAALLTLLATTWLVTILLFLIATILIFVIILFKNKIGIFSLIILVPIAANFDGIQLHTFWSTSHELLPLFTWIAVISFFAILIKKAARIKEYNFSTPIDFFILSFFFLALTSTLWSPNVYHSLFQNLLLFVDFLLFYTIATSLQDESLYRSTVKVLIFWGFVVAALSIASLHYLDETNLYFYEMYDIITFNYAIKHHETRALAIANPNATAMFLNIVMAFSLCFFFNLKNRFKRCVILGIILFLAYGVLETKSKGGTISLIIMILIFLLAMHRLRKHLIRNFLLIYVILILMFIFQSLLLGRTPRILASEEMSLGARIEIWTEAFAKVKTISLVRGLSVGGLIYYQDPLPHAHSIYFSTLFDMGLIGLILQTCIMLVIVVKTLTSLTHQNTYPQIMLVASGAALGCISVHGLVDFSYSNPIIWLFLGINVATLKLVEMEKNDTKLRRFT